MGRKTVACPRCKTELDISGFQPGSRIRCGACNSVLRIPERKPAPAPAPAASAPAPAPVPAPRPAPPPAPPPKDKDEELIGYAVGDEFEITKKLGEGGYGAVYEAVDRTLKRKVAIKLMLPSRAANKEYVGKFLREARTAAQLSHPNVVHIHRVGFDKTQKSHFLAMEYVEGVTLHDILQERGPLDVPECIEIMEQCCEGLAVAHKKNIIHRDIKPGNLMVTPQKAIKIADFGLAKIFDAEEQAKSMVIGTPFFMPPEQFEGKATDGRTDIYALGVTFYYMLTMKRPFTGSTPAQILVNIMTQEPTPTHELRPDLGEDIWPIVRRMIHRDLDQRYQDCDQIIADFKKFRKVEVADDKEPCPSCSHMNTEGANNCGGCGESLQMQCPVCGHPEEAGSRFCGECGCDMTLGFEVTNLANEGKELLEQANYQAAIEKFQEAREKDPANSDVMALLREAETRRDRLHTERTAVSALLASGDFDRAEERLTAALELYPEDEHLLALKGDLDRARAASRSGAGISTVRTLLKAKRYNNAREAAERLMMSQGRTEELVALLDEAEAAINKITALTQKAKQIAAGTAPPATVLAAWKDVLELNPDDTEARAEVEKIEKAVGAADSLIQGANRLLDSGDPAQAIKQLSDAGELATSDPRVEEVLRSARTALDELEVGAQQVREAIAAGNLDGAESQRAELAGKFAAAPTVGDLEEEIPEARAAAADKEAVDNVQSLVAEKQWAEARDAAEAFIGEGRENA
ncbi:MAG: protein kinase domain-containing protein, partial [Planctomycetota bacterium]